MARFDDAELETIKRTTDLAALIRSRGVELTGGSAGNLVGRCPFHDDETPSLVVTPGKGLWRCMSPAWTHVASAKKGDTRRTCVPK